MTLTAKRQKFIEAFCGPARLNGTLAARTAGYAEGSCSEEAYRLLRNAQIRDAIGKRLEQYSLSAAEATARMAEMARGNMSTKVVRRETKDGVLVTEEFHSKDALDKVLRLHGSYNQPEGGEVKFLILREPEDVVPTTGADDE